jgi:hypothetical protein
MLPAFEISFALSGMIARGNRGSSIFIVCALVQLAICCQVAIKAPLAVAATFGAPLRCSGSVVTIY